jgi:hypothetical protein
MSVPDDRKARLQWERAFPGLNEEWRYWWIEVDGVLLALLGDADLAVAVDVVARHHGPGVTVMAWLAKVDSFGEVVRDGKRNWVIAGPGTPTLLDTDAEQDQG